MCITLCMHVSIIIAFRMAATTARYPSTIDAFVPIQFLMFGEHKQNHPLLVCKRPLANRGGNGGRHIFTLTIS